MIDNQASFNPLRAPCGLTAADVPPEPTPDARAAVCLEHPEGKWAIGFGYKGGGFGRYKRCLECGRAFAKEIA